MTTFFVTPEMCTTAFPPQALRPNGGRVEFASGSYSHLTFSPTQPAEFVCQPGATFGAAMIQGVNGATFDGFDIRGHWQIREAWTSGSPISQNLTFKNCKASTVNSSPLRFRYGSTNITIEDCTFRRTGPIPAADVVAVYFSDYTVERPCTFTIRNCDFAGYSDGIQLGANGSLEIYRDCLIENCDCWVPGEYLIDNGKQMTAGLENAIDIKGNSASGHETIIRNCRAAGFRPSIYTGGGGPGYCFTIHETASNIRFERASVTDCESGWNIKGTTDRNITLIDCHAIGIRNNGAVTAWTDKQGSVITSTGTVHVTGLRWRGDRLEEYPSYPYSPPRTFIDCEGF